jgi:hypothetical protein
MVFVQYRTQAFVWQKGKKTALSFRRASDVEPVAIDAAGDVVGTAGNRAVLWRRRRRKRLDPRFLWHNGHVTLLPQGMSPVGVAGGWIITSDALTDRAVLPRLRR